MLPDLEPTLAELSRDGPRRFARWDAGLFDAVAVGPARALGEALSGQADWATVLAGYMRLVQQGVGTGVLRQTKATSGWASFLERCLIELVPALLPKVKPGERLPLLVKVWNLGEGLLREPSWLDRYVTACAGRLDDLAALEEFLVRTLAPVLAPAQPATWQGPFAVTVLDLRSLHDTFLPGEIALATPTVLRIEDRRRKGVQAGALLRRAGRSELLGLTQGLGDYAEVWDRPALEFQDERATLAGRAVELPFLRRCQQHAIVRAGFVAACAVDLERLWIVESS